MEFLVVLLHSSAYFRRAGVPVIAKVEKSRTLNIRLRGYIWSTGRPALMLVNERMFDRINPHSATDNRCIGRNPCDGVRWIKEESGGWLEIRQSALHQIALMLMAFGGRFDQIPNVGFVEAVATIRKSVDCAGCACIAESRRQPLGRDVERSAELNRVSG